MDPERRVLHCPEHRTVDLPEYRRAADFPDSMLADLHWDGNSWVVVMVKSWVNLLTLVQPIRSQFSSLTQLLTMTTTHQIPPLDGGLVAMFSVGGFSELSSGEFSVAGRFSFGGFSDCSASSSWPDTSWKHKYRAFTFCMFAYRKSERQSRTN